MNGLAAHGAFSGPRWTNAESASSSAASGYDPEIERERAGLVAAIAYLAANPITWTERDPVRVDTTTAESAVAFITRLPADRTFPKIAPDGEGGMMFVWNGRERKTLLSIDRTTLLLVSEPGRESSFHFSPLRFDGETIPAIVLEHLPSRA
jgi:hypothetical protein